MSKKTLNHVNLSALGADRLADLLLEVSTGSADIKRRLRLELSHDLGAAELARDVQKRLVSLRRSKSFIGWRKRKALIKDLQTQVDMITGKIAPDEPTLAFDLLWQFTDLAPSIYERTDDSRGDIGDVFRKAILAFCDIAPRAIVDPEALANRVWDAVSDNGYGEFDGIIGHVAAALGDTGFTHLKSLVAAYEAAPIETENTDHDAILFLRELRGSTANYRAERKAMRIRLIRQEIATAEGDTHAYIAQYSAQDLTRPQIAAEVAQLKLTEDLPDDALALLEAADLDPTSPCQPWDDAYIACLIALDHRDDAQAHRWKRFKDTLNADYLRPYLKALPDFDDIEAEDRARAHALKFGDAADAMKFLLNWPDHVTAAALIRNRIDELDGNDFETLTSAADALRVRFPLAAVLLWRAMINDALHHGRTSRYKHAAEHLNDCELVDADIVDYAPFPPHETYIDTLKTRYDRKSSFWRMTSSG